MKKGMVHVAARTLLLALVATFGISAMARAQSLKDPALTVSTVVSGLSQPISIAFIGPNDFLVTESDRPGQTRNQRRCSGCGARFGRELE